MALSHLGALSCLTLGLATVVILRSVLHSASYLDRTLCSILLALYFSTYVALDLYLETQGQTLRSHYWISINERFLLFSPTSQSRVFVLGGPEGPSECDRDRAGLLN